MTNARDLSHDPERLDQVEHRLGMLERLKAKYGPLLADVVTFAAAGPGRIACNQVCSHLKARTIEHRVIPWCERHHVAVVAYGPFGSGDFPKATSPAAASWRKWGRSTA